MKIGKHDPILTMCEAGLDRSACLKIELVAGRGYQNVLNCGVETVDKDTLEMLKNWAKVVIVIADTSVWAKVPWDMKGKAVFYDIGKDIWRSPDNPELRKICVEVADDLGL